MGGAQLAGAHLSAAMKERSADARCLRGAHTSAHALGRGSKAGRGRRGVARPLAKVLAPPARALAAKSRWAARAQRTGVVEDQADDLLRELNGDGLEEAALAQRGAGEMGASEDTEEACAVCDRVVGASSDEPNFTMCCANCHQQFHATCYYSAEALADGRVRGWQSAGCWICGVCVQGEVISSSMEAQASGDQAMEGDSESGRGMLEGCELAAGEPRRKARGDGFLTAHGLWRGGGVVSAALDFTAIFKGMPTVYPSLCKCARCGGLTRTRRCGSCGWDTLVVVRCPLELRDLLTGNHSWAAEPRFCARCASWLPWKRWSAEAEVWAGRLIHVLHRCADLEILLGRFHGGPEDPEAAKEWAAMRREVLEYVVGFIGACMSWHRRRPACESARSRGGQRVLVSFSPMTAKLATTPGGAWGGMVRRGLENVGGSCGVAVVVQLLRACASARAAIDTACTHTLGSGIWGPLAQLFAAMDAGISVGQSFTALIQSWRAERILTEFGGGVDPAQVLFRLLQHPGDVGRVLQQLVGFRTNTQSVCAVCRVREEDERTEHSFVALPGYRSLQRQIDKPDLGSRTCSCGGVRQGCSFSWTSLGDVFIVQGDCRFDAVPTTLVVRVGQQTVELTLVALFEDDGGHHRLHLRGSVASDGEAEWSVFDDGMVTSTECTSRGVGGVFMKGAANRRSSLWAYARLTPGRTHARNVGLAHPCDSGCDAAECANQVEWDKVKADICPWLPGQWGLFAKENLRAGTWVARFEVGPTQAPSNRAQPGRALALQVRQSGGAGWTPTSAIVPLGAGVAMAANSTCCPRHQNAEIVQDAEDRVWIRLVADVVASGEILVNYGAGFFVQGSCVCCVCSGRCSRQTDSHATGDHTRRNQGAGGESTW